MHVVFLLAHVETRGRRIVTERWDSGLRSTCRDAGLAVRLVARSLERVSHGWTWRRLPSGTVRA